MHRWIVYYNVHLEIKLWYFHVNFNVFEFEYASSYFNMA